QQALPTAARPHGFPSMHPLPLRCAIVALLFASLPAAAQDRPAEAPKGGIASRLRPFVDSHTLAGAVTLVASQDRGRSLGARGRAEGEAKRPWRTDALFWIAARSKPITAAAVMMLADDGKVKLDDPAEKYLPELKDLRVKDGTELRKPKHPVTV